MTPDTITWAALAAGEAVVLMGFGAVIWQGISESLRDVAKTMREISAEVHGHGIEIANLKEQVGHRHGR